MPLEAACRSNVSHATIAEKEKAPRRAWHTEGLGGPGNNLLSRISNIIGGFCLTTVFGMGTGMTRILWSPGLRWPAQDAGPRWKKGELGSRDKLLSIEGYSFPSSTTRVGVEKGS